MLHYLDTKNSDAGKEGELFEEDFFPPMWEESCIRKLHIFKLNRELLPSWKKHFVL